MVKSLTLEKIGNTDFFKADFNPELNIIRTCDVDSLCFALGAVTDNFPLCRDFPTLLRRESKIISEVYLDGDYVFDNALPADNEKISSLLHQSREEDDLCYYSYGKYRNHRVRLSEYKDHEYFYPEKGLGRLTNGCCLVRSFRAYLNEYVRSFKPKRLDPRKDYFMDITDSGELFVRRENGERPQISASEQTLFDFFCFLCVIEFWDGFGEIRDCSRIRKPIVIADMLEAIDESIPRKHLLNRLKRLDRQVFLIERISHSQGVHTSLAGHTEE